MEATFIITDKQRVRTLGMVYRKGMTTPKEELGFSSDKLVYLQPFLAKLQDKAPDNLSNRVLVRQIVDQLLQDIVDEVSLSANASKLAVDYGLTALMNTENEFMYERKVA